MRVLFLDTETNGLPTRRFASFTDLHVWPDILQLSWAIYEDAHLLEHRNHHLRLPPGVAWDASAAAIHGISEADARDSSRISAKDALTELGTAMTTVDWIVAHNLAFDKPILRAAALKVGLHIWEPSLRCRELCTMEATRNLLRIPFPSRHTGGRNKWKAPRLNELHTWLFGHRYDISGASLHSAESDVDCLAKCFFELVKRRFIDVCVASGCGDGSVSVSAASASAATPATH